MTLEFIKLNKQNTFIDFFLNQNYCSNIIGQSTLCKVNLDCFSHDGKVRILNRDSRCASWITIRNTVFWTMCTPNHIEICDLRCACISNHGPEVFSSYASQITNLDVIWRTHGPKYRILNRDSRCASRITIQNMHSCENSLNASNLAAS